MQEIDTRETKEPAVLAADVARVLQVLLELGNDVQKSLRAIADVPIRPFDGRTALEMIEAGRTEDVVAYLQSLSAGWVG
jgi:hypothetical protein